MGLAIGVRDPRRQRHLALPPRRIAETARGGDPGFRSQDQLRLPRPDQVDIDFGQQLGVEQRAADGRTRLRFYPADIKGLATLLWANADTVSRFVGGRCNDKKPAVDASGRLVSERCFDTNPGTFHLGVVNQLGGSMHSICKDQFADALVTIANRVLIRNKVAGFIITGGQDNVQQVAGHMLGFFGEIGCVFPQFPYIAHSRGWPAEDMENNEREVRRSTQLHDGAEALVTRCVLMARALVEAEEGPRALVRGGRKGMSLDAPPSPAAE